MAGKDTEYEKFVRDIMEHLLHAQGLETVKVQHDVDLPGISRTRQIDVYWEYRLGGISHRVIINCKRYKKTVEVGDVEELSGVLHDMPGYRGVIVTTVGFQKGAVTYATTHEIGLKVIRPPQDEDWEGRLREVHMHMQLDMPKLTGCNIVLNHDWNKANVTEDVASLVGVSKMDARLMTVRDLKSGTVFDMNELWNQLMVENPTVAGSKGVGVVRWEDARLEQPGAVPLRVDSIEFKWEVEKGSPGPVIKIRSEPFAIVRDAIAGTLLFVDPDGKITGDVKEELGRE